MNPDDGKPGTGAEAVFAEVGKRTTSWLPSLLVQPRRTDQAIIFENVDGSPIDGISHLDWSISTYADAGTERPASSDGMHPSLFRHEESTFVRAWKEIHLKARTSTVRLEATILSSYGSNAALRPWSLSLAFGTGVHRGQSVRAVCCRPEAASAVYVEIDRKGTASLHGMAWGIMEFKEAVRVARRPITRKIVDLGAPPISHAEAAGMPDEALVAFLWNWIRQEESLLPLIAIPGLNGIPQLDDPTLLVEPDVPTVEAFEEAVMNGIWALGLPAEAYPITVSWRLPPSLEAGRRSGMSFRWQSDEMKPPRDGKLHYPGIGMANPIKLAYEAHPCAQWRMQPVGAWPWLPVASRWKRADAPWCLKVDAPTGHQSLEAARWLIDAILAQPHPSQRANRR